MSSGKNFTWETTSDEVVKTYVDRVQGRTFLITGAGVNSIGAETAIALARHGSPAQLILPGRSLDTIGPVIDQIKEINKDVKVYYVRLDLSDQSATRRAAEEVLNNQEITKIDVLINCAGVMGCPYTETAYKDEDGKPIDLHFAANHLGHFLLTNLILEKVRKAAPGARIINVTSCGHRFGGIRFGDLGFSNGTYDLFDAYGQSKTANILMANYLAEKIPSKEIASFSIHPGAVMETRLTRFDSSTDMASQALARISSIPDFEPLHMKSIPQGASTTLVAALDPSLEAYSGAYLYNCQIGSPAKHTQSKENAEKLWSLSEKIVGQQLPLGK